MLVSTLLTAGQVTFILRIVIQILSSGGLFFVGLIVLGNAPRIASVATHDVLSRIAGGETMTITALKWLFKRGKTNDPTGTSKLAVGVALLLSYSLFVKLTDVGLIGFHTCTTRGPDFLDFPASVRDDASALKLLRENMVNGTDPASVKYFRCDAFDVRYGFSSNNITMYACTAWTNSTYADKTVFQDLNISDTAVLMPRQLTRYHHKSSDVIELDGYLISPLYRRVSKPTIMNGLAVIPHETGFRAFLGAPNPTPFTRYTLPQTLALEADVGCMAVGWYSQDSVYSMASEPLQVFSTDPNGSWREYAGPAYLRDVISRSVDEVRDYLKPLWNMSTLDITPGLVLGNNGTFTILSSAAYIKPDMLPRLPGQDSTLMVGILVGTSLEIVLSAWKVNSMLVNPIFASSATRIHATYWGLVNLVRADIEIDGNGVADVTFERLPSDIHVTTADWWYAHRVGADTELDSFNPIYRYALTPNPAGTANHFIRPHSNIFMDTATTAYGPGGGANVFPNVGGLMLVIGDQLKDQFGSLSYLEEEYQAINFTPSRVTRWSGELGASYILGSSAFNGWVANSVQGGLITVVSTGGRAATCYDPFYAIALIPLVLAIILVFIVSLGMLFTSSLLNASQMKGLYAGLQPYASILLPDSSQLQTLLVWEYDGRALLEPVQNGQPIPVSGAGTAVEHLRRVKTQE